MNDTYTKHEEQSNFKIPVRIQGNIKEIKPVNNDVFDGVYHNKSTHSGILRFLEMINIKTTFV